MPAGASLGTLAEEGGRAYLGYGLPGGVIVRCPSGVSERFSAGVAVAAVAEAVLSDRLGHAAPQQLVEVFGRVWVEPRTHGEFVWPVIALDEWLSAQNAGDACPKGAMRPRGALGGMLGAAMYALPRARSAALFRRSLSSQGGH